MGNNVSTNTLTGLAGEIQNAVNQLKQEVAVVRESTASIKAQCETLNSYNNQQVTGSARTEKKYKKGRNDKTVLDKTIVRRERWEITGQEEILGDCNNIENELASLEDSLALLTSEATNIELVSEVIESYIQSIQTELGENIDSKVLNSAFATLGASIAYNAADAANGNYISKDKILDEYWNSSVLRFERQANGSYLIYKKDENGTEVAMGFTSALTATTYLTQVKQSTTGSSKQQTTKDVPKEVENPTPPKNTKTTILGEVDLDEAEARKKEVFETLAPGGDYEKVKQNSEQERQRVEELLMPNKKPASKQQAEKVIISSKVDPNATSTVINQSSKDINKTMEQVKNNPVGSSVEQTASTLGAGTSGKFGSNISTPTEAAQKEIPKTDPADAGILGTFNGSSKTNPSLNEINNQALNNNK